MKSRFHFKCPICDYECHPEVAVSIEPALNELFAHLAGHIKELFEKID